jgi:hypothetical protein
MFSSVSGTMPPQSAPSPSGAAGSASAAPCLPTAGGSSSSGAAHFNFFEGSGIQMFSSLSEATVQCRGVAKNDHSSMTCLLTVPPAGVRVPAMKYLGPPGRTPPPGFGSPLPSVRSPPSPSPAPLPPAPTDGQVAPPREEAPGGPGGAGWSGRPGLLGRGGWFLGVPGRPRPGERVGWEGFPVLELAGRALSECATSSSSESCV